MKNKRENGEVVVEASVIVTIVLILMTVMLYAGIMLYQQTLISVMANQAASNIAKVYSNNLKDPFTGYVDPSKVYQSVTYNNMKTDAYMDVLKRKAAVFTQYRLKTSNVLSNGTSSVNVEVVKKNNELFKSQVVVTVHDRYNVPIVEWFGTDGALEFEAVGRADCVDILEYMHGTDAIGDPENTNPTPVFEDVCYVQFVPNRQDGKIAYSIPVLKGKSIYSSNAYTNATMPADPRSTTYEFAGWVLPNGTNFTAMTEISATTTVYGKWLCTVTFSPEGGSVSPTSKKVTVGERTSFPFPTRPGYAFLGWYTSPNGIGVAYNSNITVVNDHVTLYAAWRCTHDYELQSTTPGTCVTAGQLFYKCVRCGSAKQEEGSLGDHTFQYSHTTGYWCFERANVYSCQHCSATYTTVRNDGAHNYSAQCNVAHRCTAGKFLCSTNTPAYTQGACQTTKMFHITCEYCGDICHVETWSGGKLISKETYRCGLHGVVPLRTGCGHSGSKK